MNLDRFYNLVDTIIKPWAVSILLFLHPQLYIKGSSIPFDSDHLVLYSKDS